MLYRTCDTYSKILYFLSVCDILPNTVFAGTVPDLQNNY